MTDDLYEHQRPALKKLSNGKILRGGVGSGKSRVAATYYIQREAPRHVYVITTARKRDEFDWHEEFYRLGIGPRSGPVGIPSQVLRGSGGSAQQLGEGHAAVPGEALAESGGVSGSGVVSKPRGKRNRKGDSNTAVDPGYRHADIIGEAGVYPWVLTVDSWNNIAKYADVAGAFFIFDEQRLVGSGDWVRKFLRIAKRNHWIMLTATPGDSWMDYIPVFIANGFYKNRTEFKREHVVYNTFTKFPKVDRYINQGRLVRHRKDVLVDMPFERHTRRRIVEVPLLYDKDLVEQVIKKRWHVYEERPLRDVAEMFLVLRRVVNSHPSRLEMVCNLWENVHPRLIVFYNFNFELESLRSLKEYYGISGSPNTCSSPKKTLTFNTRQSNDTFTQSSKDTLKTSVMPSSNKLIEKLRAESFTGLQVPESNILTTGKSKKMSGLHNARPMPKPTILNPKVLGETTTSSIAISEWNGHKHEPVPTTDRWLYLVQYSAGAEAWNCITTDAMAMYSRNYSWKVTEQSYGRIDRLNSPFKDLWYYDFMTDSPIDRAIGRALKAKKTFNEAEYAGMFK